MDAAERDKLKRAALDLLALAEPVRHSPGFGSVLWFGEYHVFSATQARVIEILWAAYMAGTPDVRGEYLLRAAGSEATKLAHVFRGHAAWGRMVAAHPTAKGLFHLQRPPDTPIPPENPP